MSYSGIKWDVKFHRGFYGKDHKPERDFPSNQICYTEKTLQREENFIYNLIYKMRHFKDILKDDRVRFTWRRDLDNAYRYLDCVDGLINGKRIDLKQAYWDLGIYELTKIYG